MVVVHHLEDSRSQRILWILEELGVDYRVKRYARDPKTALAPEALRKVHPLGKAPVITDQGQTYAESGVIIEYLARTYGDERWAPRPDDSAYWRFAYWMHYAEASMMPPLLLKLVFDKLRNGPVPFFVKPVLRKIADEVDKAFINQQIKTHFSYVDQYLADHEWFAGSDISAADIQMSFPLEAALARGTIDDAYPAIVAYVQRFQARDAYRKALKRGGDYAYGPAE
ncbi:MAG: glutathione S-transferase [Wenzhouxiangella sp.]|jgi:glutathione S-transferase|nr:glutathione S-transferase [Wenzhouxiangella sp.]